MTTHKVINDVMLMEPIGKGAYSEVFRGIQKRGNTEREVAVKVIPRTIKNATSIDDEIQILRTIKHPNIINFLNQYNTKNNTYVITEYCSLGNFKSFIKTNFPSSIVPEDQARHFFRQVCCGVSEIHRQGIVHRDLKLDNIFITRDHKIKIGDFGFAKTIGSGDTMQSFKGTPINMAPEIFKTDIKLASSYNAKCDIWSLGTVLYEMVFGQIIATHVQTIKELSALLLSDKDLDFPEGTGVSPECRDLITKMLRKNPDQRLDIQGVLAHPWVKMSEDNPLLASILIKSFFQTSETGIEQISRETFEKARLREWVCLNFKNGFRESLSDIARKITKIAEKTTLATQVFCEFCSQYPALLELNKLLWSKFCYLVEKMGKIKIVSEKTTPQVVAAISQMISDVSSQFELPKLMEKGRAWAGEVTTDSTGGDLLRKLYTKYFEVAEAAFKNEFTADAEGHPELLQRERPFQLQLLKVIRMIGFDFVGVQYEITFLKELREKELDFDPYTIDRYLDDFLEIEFDDFNSVETTKLATVAKVKVEVEYQEEITEGNFGKAVEVFTRAFKNRFESIFERETVPREEVA